MQIKGEDFLKKVQLQQEKEELERKLTELDESRISINSINLGNNLNNAYRNVEEETSSINLNRNSMNNQLEDEPHDFDNIMLENPTFGNNGEDNKKKYLILGILLVVLFLLTIIIIRLLTSDSKKEDQFTSNNNSSEMRTLSENSNAIDANYQKIVDTDRARKESNETMVPLPNATSTDTKLNTIQEANQANNTPSVNETYQAEAKNSISNQEMDDTIKKIEEKKANKKEETVQKTPTAKTESKKSIKDLVEGNSTSSSTAQNFSSGANGYFVQIGAFSKRPSESYLNSITKEGFKYKVIQEEVKGTMYNKLLIGPYSSSSTASSSVSTIKEKLNVTSAFVVKY
jgi:DedD protein